MKPIKKLIKLNILGVFRLETENMNLMEIILILVTVMTFVIIFIFLSKIYVLPVLSAPGIMNKMCSLIQLFKSRLP
jgi:hypothetical protein